jgi:hypothetical protein
LAKKAAALLKFLFHPPFVNLIFQLSHSGAFNWTQCLLRVLSIPLIHAVTQRALVYLKFADRLRIRMTRLNHEMYRLSLKLW